MIVCLLGIKLLNGANPIISEHIETAVFSRDHRFDFGQIAFGLHDSNFTAKDNPNFVEFKASLVRSVKSEKYEKEIGMHKCTKQDLEEFYPIQKRQKSQFDMLQSNDVLYCIDRDQDIDISGHDEFSDFQRFQIQLVSCKANQTNSLCVNNSYNERSAYLDSTHFVIYRNYQKFDSSTYGEKAIESMSEVDTWPLSAFMTTTIESQIQLAELHD